MECHYLLMPINKVVKFKINILLRANSDMKSIQVRYMVGRIKSGILTAM